MNKPYVGRYLGYASIIFAVAGILNALTGSVGHDVIILLVISVVLAVISMFLDKGE